MPNITADRVINKTLIAKVNIAKLDGALKQIGLFKPGATIGVVYSYILRDGKLYWMLYDSLNRPFYVQHGQNRFVITDAIASEIKKQRRELTAEEQEQLKNLKGEIPYYIEKYGIWILVSVAAIILLNTYIKNKK